MADNIIPTHPITPVPTKLPDNKDKEQKKKSETEQQDNDDKPEKPHDGLFDEYV